MDNIMNHTPIAFILLGFFASEATKYSIKISVKTKLSLSWSNSYFVYKQHLFVNNEFYFSEKESKLPKGFT